MQVQRISYQVRGFVKLARYAVRWTRMITEKAKHRLKVLIFWKQYGLPAALSAFGVSRRTLYGWRATLANGNNQPEALNNHSKRPKTLRKRTWPKPVTERIKQLRDEHPNLGKEKNELPCSSAAG